ncbi:MAG: response regulator transcription factor [Firmicutes bacterium]|jgi:DNA-binding response OmpR family regulator|nr:response regulator transcription factor [Bacillota bacterium]
MKQKILIVEDDINMLNLLQDILIDEDYQTSTAENGLIALEKHKSFQPDLVLLDVMMPELDGYSFLKEIRKDSDTPTILLTARSLEEDEIQGFELGADDYITKPFKIGLLLARINAVLSRSSKNTKKNKLDKYGDIEIKKDSLEVKIGSEVLNLTAKEYQLLIYMTDNLGIAVSRDSILDKVWGFDYYGDTRTVDTHIKRLRSKMLHCKNYIKTLRGTGYIFEVPDEIN